MDGSVSIAVDLLNYFLEHPGHHGARELGEAVALPEHAVHVEVQRLKDYGCEIESHPGQGYRVIHSGLGCWADYLQVRHAEGLGRRMIVYGRTGSTQDVARHLLMDDETPEHWDGVVVTCDEQYGGRGRLGARWESPPGHGVLLTGIVKQDASLATDHYVVASVVALAEVVEALTPLRPRIKWPNDLLVDHRKLAGILVELIEGMVLVGIGVNVGSTVKVSEHIKKKVVGLADLGAPVDRLVFMDHLLSRLDEVLHQRKAEEVLESWRQRSAMLGQEVEVSSGGEVIRGRVVDLDLNHGISLALDRGQVVQLSAATTRVLKFEGIEW